jgi:hypothetical protein
LFFDVVASADQLTPARRIIAPAKNWHSLCFFLFGTPAAAFTPCFLLDMCIGSPLLVREPTSFQTKEETKMATNNTKPTHTLRCGNIKATIWQNIGEKGPFFATTFSRPFKDQSGAWRNGTSFGLNDLEALVTVAHEAKEWIATHVLKR